MLCRKSEEECDPYNYNFLDKELYYLAQIQGSRQKYISMYLQRCTHYDDSSIDASSMAFSNSKQSGSIDCDDSDEEGSHDFEESFLDEQESLYVSV